MVPHRPRRGKDQLGRREQRFRGPGSRDFAAPPSLPFVTYISGELWPRLRGRPAHISERTGGFIVSAAAPQLLEELLTTGLLRKTDWEALPEWGRQRLSGTTDNNRLLDQLLNQKLLTGYQAGRIRARKPQWLDR